MKRQLLGVAAWLALCLAAPGEELTLPDQGGLKLDKPPETKPQYSPTSVDIRAQIIEAPDKNEPVVDRWSGLRNTKDPKRKPSGGPKSKQLAITLTRMCRAELNDVTVKWRLFAIDVESRKTVVAGSGEVPVVLTNMAAQSVTSTPPVTVTYTPPRRDYTPNQPAGRVTRGTGQRLSGWAVQAFQGDALVGEKYSDTNLKNWSENKETTKALKTKEVPLSSSTTMGIVPPSKFKPKGSSKDNP